MKVYCEKCKGTGNNQNPPSLQDYLNFKKPLCDDCKGRGYTESEELDELIELGRAIKHLFESPNVEEYVYLCVGKRNYDTLKDVIEEYKSWI